MTDEPVQEPDAAADPARTVASTEVVVRERGPGTDARRRPLPAVVRIRGRLLELRQHPGVVASVSVAATVGGTILASGLRRALSQPPGAPAGRSAPAVVVGYILHEVHVIHHVVHHVRPPLP